MYLLTKVYNYDNKIEKDTVKWWLSNPAEGCIECYNLSECKFDILFWEPYATQLANVPFVHVQR